MDKTRQRMDDTVKRMFGASAAIDGSFGTTEQPGELRIMLNGEPIGAGRTFAEAVQRAQEAIGLQSRRKKPQTLTTGQGCGAAFDTAAAGSGA